MEAIVQETEIESTASLEAAPVAGQESVGVRVAQNTLAVLAGRGVALVCGAFGSILLARLLGVERLGQYGAVYAYLSLFVWLASAGLGPVISREAARHRDQAGSIFRTGFWVCTGSVAITLVLAISLSSLANLGGRLFPLVVIASLEVILLIPANVHGLIFQVDLRQWYGSTFNVVRQGIWLAVVLSLYLAGAPLLYVVIGRFAVAAIETGLN
jgi:O-antigen/teichoic acid export membrane protein